MSCVFSPLRSLDLHEHLPRKGECSLQFIEDAIGKHIDALVSGPSLPTSLWCTTAADVSREAVALRLLPAMLHSRVSSVPDRVAKECLERLIGMERALLAKRLLSDKHVWHAHVYLLECGVVAKPVDSKTEMSDDWVLSSCSRNSMLSPLPAVTLSLSLSTRQQASGVLCQQVDVPFESCPLLVSDRSVVLQNGWARLTSVEQMVYVISRTVAVSPDWQSSPDILDSRLARIAHGHIKRLWTLLLPSRVSVEKLEQHAPCIKRMLETTPHLNFQARRVYGSYAAAAGIPVSVSVAAWRPAWQTHYKERAAIEEKAITKFWDFQRRSTLTKSPACSDVMELGFCPFVSASNKVQCACLWVCDSI
jgi:hypothetical protein